MAHSPTSREVLKARADLVAAKAAYEACKTLCIEHAAIDPLDIAYRDGTACGYMGTNPAIHWDNFLHVFGEIIGARLRFDEGVKYATSHQESLPV